MTDQEFLIPEAQTFSQHETVVFTTLNGQVVVCQFTLPSFIDFNDIKLAYPLQSFLSNKDLQLLSRPITLCRPDLPDEMISKPRSLLDSFLVSMWKRDQGEMLDGLLLVESRL